MVEIPDLSDQVYAPDLHEGVKVCSVGWLGNTVPSRGSVSIEVIDILKHLDAFHHVDDGDLGMHSCALCDSDKKFHGEIWVEVDGIRYVLPSAIIHYIQEHHYKPPDVFINDLKKYWESEACDSCKNGTCSEIDQEKSGRPRLEKKVEISKKWWKFWG
ncbi:hypothetical protein [Zooshikella ganghwensis]|uniref:DUF7919 family protein n=1 Tax=Zooshikella ganghwensis TaxID=202772 RepID=UPI000489683D|nr:hypothetical protein [Zooshikella ganghwensis]